MEVALSGQTLRFDTAASVVDAADWAFRGSMAGTWQLPLPHHNTEVVVSKASIDVTMHMGTNAGDSARLLGLAVRGNATFAGGEIIVSVDAPTADAGSQEAALSVHVRFEAKPHPTVASVMAAAAGAGAADWGDCGEVGETLLGARLEAADAILSVRPA